ncbi:ATP-binding protein [Pararhodospirillum photometricum]|nr:ATP-binding protein [Pararhodospirillum photometricum]
MTDANDDRYLSLLKALSAPIWVYGFASGHIEWANPAALVFWKADSLEGLRQRSVRPQSGAARARVEQYAARFANGNAIWEDWTFYPRDEPVVARCHFRGVSWEGQSAMLVEVRAQEGECGQSHDDARRAVETLREVPVVIMLILADGTLVSQNVAADLCFGSLEQGGFKDRFVEPQEREALLREALEQGEAPARVLAVNTRAGMAWHDVGARRVRDPATAAPALLLHGLDVTERRLHEEALRETEERLRRLAHDLALARDEAVRADAAKSEFLATMSHEIRTPMNGILGLTEHLLEGPVLPGQAERLGAIRDSAEALLTVVNDVLDFSRLEAGRLTLEIRPFALGPTLVAVLEPLRPHAQAKGLTLDLALDPTLPPWVAGDPGRLRQILINLVGNALKFTARGSVRLEVAPGVTMPGRGPNDLLFRVKDTGIGIAPDVLPRLFQRFSQADPAITRQFGGSGLGLAICRRLAEVMGGHIQAESTPGQGSVFTLCLPLPAAAPEGPPPPPPAEPLPAAPGGRPWRVLIAEDHAINRTVLAGLLHSRGLEVEFAEDGTQALHKGLTGTHDIIFMDMRMPGLDGLEVTRRLRAQGGALARVPIIAVTANAFDDDRAVCLAAGMSAFLPKPVRRDALFATVRAQLSERLALSCDLESSPMPRPPASADDAGPVSDLLDLSHAVELEDDLGIEVLISMTRSFQTSAPERAARLAASLERGDVEGARTEAHTLKGVAATLGLARLRDVTARIEQACRVPDLVQARVHAADLSPLVATSLGALADRYLV